MKSLLYVFLFSLLFNTSYASDDNYAKLFFYLEKNGIIIGQDIDEVELFELIENEPNFQSKNFNFNKLNKKINVLLKSKEKSLSKIKQEINKNPNHEVNKEVNHYVYDGNKRIEDTKKSFESDNDDSYFTKMINKFLEMMKN